MEIRQRYSTTEPWSWTKSWSELHSRSTGWWGDNQLNGRDTLLCFFGFLSAILLGEILAIIRRTPVLHYNDVNLAVFIVVDAPGTSSKLSMAPCHATHESSQVIAVSGMIPWGITMFCAVHFIVSGAHRMHVSPVFPQRIHSKSGKILKECLVVNAWIPWDDKFEQLIIRHGIHPTFITADRSEIQPSWSGLRSATRVEFSVFSIQPSGCMWQLSRTSPWRVLYLTGGKM